MKTFRVMAMVLVLAFGLCGCGKTDIKACEDVVNNLQQAVYSADVNLFQKTYIPCYYKEIEESFSSEESMRQAFVREMASIKIQMEFLDATEIDLEEGYSRLDSEVMDNHKDEIDKIYIARVRIQEKTYESIMEIPIVKIGRKWYWANRFL